MNLRRLASWLCFIGTAFAQDTQLTGFARTKELAEQGDPTAIKKLAEERQNAGDFKQAFALYLPLAETGDSQAQAEIGEWLLKGAYKPIGISLGSLVVAKPSQGIQPSKAEGIRWLNLAAAQGSGKAMYALAKASHDGDGVTKDLIEAYKWFTLAKKHGMITSGLETEQIAKVITVQDAKEGQRRADEFMALPKGQSEPIRADFLTLSLITGSTKEPIAMINGNRFTPGKTITLTRLGQPIEVTCAEITRQSVFVTFPPATNRFELRF